MHFYGALILLVTVSAACGLRCYNCVGKTCAYKITCPTNYDRCATVTVGDFTTQSCMNSTFCADPMECCSTDLCNVAIPTGNGAMPTGSSVLLLLASSAIITLFL